MPVQLLETKFHIPPVRPEYVRRSRLTEQLNGCLHCKLTLVSAPAGFGKTSLISEWVAESGRRSAWLSLDRRDNDPIRFLSYLIGALQSVKEELGGDALSLVQSAQQNSPESVLTSLINDLASEPIALTLVIDDYHVIEDREIDEILDFVIEYLPPQMHLVLSTREDPQLALARLRASGQLNELRASDLRFLTTEIADFMNDGMNLSLSPEDIGALEQRTEGWIASLQLVALSLQNQADVTRFIQSFTGGNRLILDYLVEEVLRNQPDENQDFLRQTSILERMCGPLCDVLTGRSDGQKVLEMLERSNLFVVPLDDERRWYRYHHLFAELLCQHLRDSDKELIPTLHSRAGEWYSENRFDLEAIDHALQGRDYERAAKWIESYVGQNYEKINHPTRENWLSAFPEKFLGSVPNLVLMEAWSSLRGGRLDKAEQCLAAIASSSVPSAGTDRDTPETTDQIQGRIAVIRSLIAENHGIRSEVIRYGKQALETLPSDELFWRCVALINLARAYEAEGQLDEARRTRDEAVLVGTESRDVILILTVNLINAEVLRERGNLGEVISICRRMVDVTETERIANSSAVGWLLAVYSEVLAEMNSLDEALEFVKEGASIYDHSSDIPGLSTIGLSMIRVLFSSGDITGAREAAQSLQKIADVSDIDRRKEMLLSSWNVRIWLAEQDLESAGRWAEERHCSLDGEPSRLYEPEYFALARVKIAQNRANEALRLLEWAHPLSKSDDRLSTVIVSLSLQALAHQALGDTSHALDILHQALCLAEPEGFFRVFIDEGPSMASLLYEAAVGEGSSEYVRLLCAGFPTVESVPPRNERTESSSRESVERLSERELDVLQLVAEGMSNEQIGEKLFISIHTVKVHTRNIFSKLDTHNRTEAVARARSYGILSSD